MEKLSLEKKKELVRVILSKRNVPENIVVAVKAALDVSGSMSHMFGDGTVQELVDRLIPVAMRFDDNQSIEMYAYSDRAVRTSDIKPNSVGVYIQQFLKDARSVLWSGTAYSSALKLIRDDIKPKTASMFGFLKKSASGTPGPTYLKFITDGDTGDERETETLIKELGGLNVYVQMIGVGRGSSFRFLKQMADKYDFVGFVTFPDLERTSDEQMYEALLGEEFCEWLKTR